VIRFEKIIIILLCAARPRGVIVCGGGQNARGDARVVAPPWMARAAGGAKRRARCSADGHARRCGADGARVGENGGEREWKMERG